MEIWIYGASDDLIEVDGDIREEFAATYNAIDTLVASPMDITIVVNYDSEGFWRLAVNGNHDCVEHYKLGEHDYKNYSEAIRIEADDIEIEQV